LTVAPISLPASVPPLVSMTLYGLLMFFGQQGDLQALLEGGLRVSERGSGTEGERGQEQGT